VALKESLRDRTVDELILKDRPTVRVLARASTEQTCLLNNAERFRALTPRRADEITIIVGGQKREFDFIRPKDRRLDRFSSDEKARGEEALILPDELLERDIVELFIDG